MKKYLDISLVIPAYDGDVHLLGELLNKIYGYSEIPKQIIVVVSGVTSISQYTDAYKNYSEPELICCQISKRINQAKARNIGSKFAASKLIMFHDVDDIPHHQKFAITEAVFIQDPSIDFMVHGYKNDDENVQRDYGNALKLDYHLRPHTETMGIVGSSGMAIHNSHITVHKKIFDIHELAFEESTKAYRIEDSLFTVSLLKKELQGVMVCAELVCYRPSGSR